MPFYYYNIRHSRFYLNTEEKNIKLAIWVDSAPGMEQMLSTMLRGPFFMGLDKKMHKMPEERCLFFTEYIPRVFKGANPEIHQVKSIEDLPDYDWEKHVNWDIYKK